MRTLFLSDLHFADAATERGRRVLAFLAEARDAEAVYLVGDVFDFNLGYPITLYRAHFPLLRALADLVDGGTAVHLFSGNHDPDPGDFFAEIGVAVHEGPLEIELGGRRVRVEHGDVVDPRGAFKRGVCKAVRHPIVRRLARVAPATTLWRLAGLYAHTGSYDRDETFPEALLSAYLPARAREGVDVVVMGHYHHAVHHRATVDGRPVRFYCLGDWVRHFTWLEHGAGGLRLMRRAAGGPVELGPGDHPPAA